MTTFGFHTHELVDGEQGDDVGGGADLPTAVAVACAYFIAKQAAGMSPTYCVGVYDATDTLIALVGKE